MVGLGLVLSSGIVHCLAGWARVTVGKILVGGNFHDPQTRYYYRWDTRGPWLKLSKSWVGVDITQILGNESTQIYESNQEINLSMGSVEILLLTYSH